MQKERPGARFVIVGDGYLRPELESLARSLGLDDRLSVSGRLADPSGHIRDFHVGVTTTETEGFCNALVEYMAFGLPVVATAVGGNPELIREEENSFLVPIADPSALSAAILLALSDDGVCLAMGRRNAEKIRHDFRLESMVENHQSYY